MDRPDDADVPSGKHPARSYGAGEGAVRTETRYRQDYYDDLRAAVAQETRAQAPKTTDPQGAADPAEREANGTPWEEVTGWSRRVWAEYQRKWPPEERTPPDQSNDQPGPSRKDGNQPLDRAVNEECDHIAEREQERISPALLEIERRDPDRHLVGFEYRLKGRDRILEKVGISLLARSYSICPTALAYPNAS